MGYVTIDDIVTRLNDADIAAAHGYPGEKYTHIDEVAVAITMVGAALREQTITYRASILVPIELGSVTSESGALGIAELLTSMGGNCTVEDSSFDGRLGVFRTDIKAVFITEKPGVEINSVPLENVEAFTSWRMVDEDAGITELKDAPWCFRLEEFFPIGTDEDGDYTEPFQLSHFSSAGTETYTGCKWTYRKRTWGPTGIRQIWLGTAEDMATG